MFCSDTRYRRCVFQNSAYIDRQQCGQALGRNGGRMSLITPVIAAIMPSQRILGKLVRF